MTTPLKAAVLGLLLLALPASAQDDETMIKRFCLAAFDAAMKQAGTPPPAGMGESTCDCFIKQVNQGAGLDAAKQTCTAEAIKAFQS